MVKNYVISLQFIHALSTVGKRSILHVTGDPWTMPKSRSVHANVIRDSCADRRHLLQSSKASLKVANQRLQLKVVALDRALLAVKHDRRVISHITTNDDKVKFYTGLPSCAVFHFLLECMQPKVEEVHHATGETELGRIMNLNNYEEQFLTVLMRLHLGLLTVDVAQRFEVFPATISRVFTTWTRILAAGMKVIFPWSSEQWIQAWALASFKKYQNTHIIIDYTNFLYKDHHHSRGITGVFTLQASQYIQDANLN